MGMSSHGKATKGSQYLLQNHVENQAYQLAAEITGRSASLLAFHGNFEWVSPLKSENYQEYQDDFLDALGLSQFNTARAQFWPKRGPQWDGLAKVKRDGQTGYVLIEAKAHPGETQSSTQAQGDSLKKINASLRATQMHLAIKPQDWTQDHYQTANRLAFLYFMNVRLELPTWLAFVNFTDDQTHIPTDLKTFVKHYQDLYQQMGLARATQLMDRVITVFTPA